MDYESVKSDRDELWEINAAWWQEGFTDGADPEYEEQIIPMARQRLRGAARVLDVGTGEGQLARLAVQAGAEMVVGIDPTWAQVTVAQRKGGGPHYLGSGAAELPFRDASFDAVLACLVFEHIEAVDEAIAEVARVLAPGGRFVFFLGRGVSHAVALEGALKLKEIAYVPCMAYPAAEMKHGPIALIEKGTPVIVIVPDDVMLFRYSALTFNGHRIHYDRRYVTGEEGYPGLIVHGPLIATLLVDLLRRNTHATLKAFKFRAVSPLFDIAPFSVHGAPGEDGKVKLWARNPSGGLALDAEAELR